MYYFCSPCPVGFNRIVEFQAPLQMRIDDCNCLVFNLPSQLSEWIDVLLWLIHREQENPPFSLQTTALFPIRLQVQYYFNQDPVFHPGNSWNRSTVEKLLNSLCSLKYQQDNSSFVIPPTSQFQTSGDNCPGFPTWFEPTK